LNLEADESVDWFAAINIFKLTSSFKQNDAVEAGNSHSVPTPYPYYCRIGECEFRTWNFKFSGESPNIVRWQQTKVLYMRPARPPILFSTEESLNTHVNQHHDYRSRPCQRCPNAPGVLYHDINKWKRHQSKAHDDFDEPKHCSLRHEEERNIVETLYEHQNPPRLHLTQIHRESTKEINV
jgi:uncharacterized C2H2 Zn-finger protein